MKCKRFQRGRKTNKDVNWGRKIDSTIYIWVLDN